VVPKPSVCDDGDIRLANGCLTVTIAMILGLLHVDTMKWLEFTVNVCIMNNHK